MLYHVDRRRVLEQPAGEDLAPGQLAVGIGAFFDKDLDEGPGFGRALPRQGPLAGGQPHHDIADAAGFAGLQDNVLRDVVPFVEQAQRGNPVLDRRAILALYGRRARLGSNGLGDFGCGCIGITTAVARGQQQNQTGRKQAPHRQASGLHAS